MDELIVDLASHGVALKALGEVGEFVRGNGLQKSDLTDEGFPAIHYGQVHTYYGIWTESTKSFTNPTLAARLRRAEPGDLIIATTSEDDEAVAKATAWLGSEEVAVSGDAYIYRHSLDPRYVAYFFTSERFQEQKKRYINGTKVRRVSGASLAKIRIPVPPLEVQQEIVRVLDQFAELEAELKAELEAELDGRRRQYEYYRSSLLASTAQEGAVWSTLGQVSSHVSSGATPTARKSEYYENGTIPWLRTSEVRFGEIWDAEMRITDRALQETAVSWIPENCVIVAISGATAARSAVNKVPLTTNQHCCNLQIDETRADYRYVFYWVSSKYEELKAFGRGARADLNAKLIKDFPIPVPPLEDQRRIVALLEKFDALVDDLSAGLPAERAARRKQYEYYRDSLFAFEELIFEEAAA
ncbi:restriction endonuclease subunit S [Arthrobacter sp. NPDC058192]|uniref:restriction endonuclease subunit S n=1 Tax=Arthrobacter sp. NPDC058192 TaxID=3346372 RepID=UPI0036E83F6C